jgi:hypothetical protein
MQGSRTAVARTRAVAASGDTCDPAAYPKPMRRRATPADAVDPQWPYRRAWGCY